MNRRQIALLALVLSAAACEQPPAPKSAAAPAAHPPLAPIVVIPTPQPPQAVAQKNIVEPREDSNKALAERVKRALEDESKIHAAAIDVTAAAGTVTLWGTAATDDERARATRVAARIAGVKWVDNRLAVVKGS